MHWDDYYNGFYDWAESTQISYISKIESFDNALSSEISEVVQEIFDKKVASRLIRKAVGGGIRFTAEEILDAIELIDSDATSQMLATAKGKFSQDDIDFLYGMIDDDILRKLANKHNIPFPDEPDETTESDQQEASFDLGIFALLAVLGFSRKKKKLSFKIGEHVRVRYRGQEGTVVDINGDYYMVSMKDGRYVDSYLASDLEKAW